jgi:hypothetical protein
VKNLSQGRKKPVIVVKTLSQGRKKPVIVEKNLSQGRKNLSHSSEKPQPG